MAKFCFSFWFSDKTQSKNMSFNNHYQVRKGSTIKEDKIVLYDGYFTICGTRKSRLAVENVFDNPGNYLLDEIVKCLVFLYLCLNAKIEKNKIEIIWERKNPEIIIADSSRILVNLKKELSTDQIIPIDIGKKLFVQNKDELKNKEKINELCNCLIDYAYALNYESDNIEIKFYYYWKAYNSIYNFISSEESEEQKKQNVEDEVKKLDNFESFSKGVVMAHIDEIKSIDLKSFIQKNAYYKKHFNSFESVVNLINQKKDKILQQLYYEVYTRCPFLFDETSTKKEEKDKIKQKMDRTIHRSQKENYSELFLFLVNRFGYWLRCKFFHGESKPVSFVLINSKEKQYLEMEISLLEQFLPYLFCNVVSKFLKID